MALPPFSDRYTFALPTSLARRFESTVADTKYTPVFGIVTSQSVVTVWVTSITFEPTLDTWLIVVQSTECDIAKMIE